MQYWSSALAALVATGASAGTTVLPAQKNALHAVNKAAKAGRVDPATAARARSEIARAARLIRGLPNGRGVHVGVALSELAAFDGRLTKPRAVALVGQLKANDDWFAAHWAPADEDRHHRRRRGRLPLLRGTLLRVPPTRRLRRAERAHRGRRRRGPQRLADALIARGVVPDGRRSRLGVLLRLLRRACAVAVGDGAGRCGAGVRARRALMIPEESDAYLRAARGAFDVIPGAC